MGNRGLSRSLGLGNKTKEFQSIAPFPANEVSQEEKIENVKNSRAAIQEVGRIDDHQVKDVASSSAIVYKETEGKLRRDNLANFESECSQISKFIFVSGMKVAADYDLLVEKGIKRIINCAPVVSPNFHEGTGSFRYLTINLMDGRVEDISWFMSQAIQFIKEGILQGEKVLIHCEKGVSRSCSIAIAHRMWQTGESWKISFDFVKSQRRICSPNTAFTVNLIELTELFTGAASRATLLFRLAYHAAYDPDTPVLKLCRNESNRRILVPATSLLNPKAVFVLRAVRMTVANDPSSVSSINSPDYNESLIGRHDLFVWMGRESTAAAQDMGIKQARLMIDVFSQAKDIKVVKEGHEPTEFLGFLAADGPFQRHTNNGVAAYPDYYGACQPTEAELQEAAAVRLAAASITQDFMLSMLTRTQQHQGSQSSLGTETAPPTSATVSRNNSNAKLSLPLVSVAINGNNNIAEDNASRPRSRSNTVLSFNNNSTDLAVSIPAALSRANSFSSIDSDGQPVFSREERLSRINNIIEAAVGAVSTSSPVLGTNTQSSGSSSNSSRGKHRPMKRQRGEETTNSDNDLENSSLDTIDSPVTLVRNKNTTSKGMIMSIDRRNDSVDSSDAQRLSEDLIVTEGHNAPVSGMALSIPVARLAEVQTDENDGNCDMARVSSKSRFVPAISLYPLTEARDSASNSAINTSRPPSATASIGSLRGITGAGALSLSLSLPLNDNNGNSRSSLSPPSHVNNSGLHTNTLVSSNSKLGLGVPLALSVSRPSLQLSMNQQPSDLPPMSCRSDSRPTLSPAAVPTVVSESKPASNVIEPRKLLIKPMLFQVAAAEDSNAIGKWVAMGVYDDEDLDQQNALLLLCPIHSHFLWVGNESEFLPAFSSFLKGQDAKNIGPWLQSTFSLGELPDWEIDWLHDSFHVETPDEESEAFWEKFNEGF